MRDGADDRGEVLRSGSSGMQWEVVLVRRRGVTRDILVVKKSARRSIQYRTCRVVGNWL